MSGGDHRAPVRSVLRDCTPAPGSPVPAARTGLSAGPKEADGCPECRPRPGDQDRAVGLPTRDDVSAVMRDADEPRLVFQPIVDLRLGVVAGYEALARFARTPARPPDVWFAAADRYGVGAELEARVVRAAARARDELPAGCFLTVNVSPHLLLEGALVEALTSAGDLTGLVLELTEHVQVRDGERLCALLAHLRRAGAVIALDDAGSGYSGLQQMAVIRPELVKIDRALVDHADRDEVKLALAELLGAYAGRLDASVIAEGVERPEELEAFVRLGVPLAQGWLFGRPGPAWPALPPEQADAIRRLAAAQERVDRIAGLLERTATVREDAVDGAAGLLGEQRDLELVAVVDRHDRALCLLRRGQRRGDEDADWQVVPITLRATANASLTDVATRAMTRSERTRFDPVVCTDAYGGYLGVVRLERLVSRLAERPSSADRPRTGPPEPDAQTTSTQRSPIRATGART